MAWVSRYWFRVLSVVTEQGLHKDFGFYMAASFIRLRFYFRLSRHSRQALIRTKTSWGRTYQYIPQRRLLSRLSRESGLTPAQVHDVLLEERRQLLENPEAAIFPLF